MYIYKYVYRHILPYTIKADSSREKQIENLRRSPVARQHEDEQAQDERHDFEHVVISDALRFGLADVAVFCFFLEVRIRHAVFMCICVCVFVCVYTYIYEYIYMFVYIPICTHIACSNIEYPAVRPCG